MDAIAIKTADGLIQSGDRATASEFQRLACILSRNDCREVAETFTRLAARQQTAAAAVTLAAMLAKLHTFSLLGIDALPVVAEVDVSYAALPKTVLVGLPEQAVKESIHRIERAIVNSGFVLPANRVVVNLAPGDLPKQATSFDLPIALGLLAASGQIATDLLDQYAIVGELALDGTMRPVKGVLSMAIAAKAAGHIRGLILPAINADEAAVVEGVDVIPVSSLTEAAAFLIEQLAIEPVPCRVAELFDELGRYEEDFADVRGQEMAKRAVMIAAAGRHNLLMVGPFTPPALSASPTAA